MRNQDGAIARGLLWVFGGLLVALGLFVLTAPEVVSSEPRIALGAIGVVLLAGVPGIIVLGWAAVKRHRLGMDDEPHERQRSPREPNDLGE